MQHTRSHRIDANRRDYKRQATRPSVDGVSPRSSQGYERRSSGMLPGTDTEYMISLGSRASRRNDAPEPKQSFLENLQKKVNKLRWQVSWQNLRFNQSLLAIVGITSLLLFVGFSLTRLNSPITANQDTRQTLVGNGDTPHENVPYNQTGFAVAPDLPKQLTIQKLGISARVTRLSVRENSEPKYPQNIYDVGWYENSAKPGEAGAALLIGHINGAEKQGVFHDLTNLVPGDEFQIEMGDGTIKNFYIVKMEAYDRNNVDYQALLETGLEGKPGLNLLTAVGAFESNADVVQQLGVFAVEKTSFLEDTN